MTPEQEKAVARVIRAVTNPGQAPHVHQQEVDRLATAWRPLALALGDLLTSYDVPAPLGWRKGERP